MREAAIGAILISGLCAAMPVRAQRAPAGPMNPKAQKTYEEAEKYAQKSQYRDALDSFKKADKQDGGRCAACQSAVIKYGTELQDWKTAAEAAQEELAEAQGNGGLATAHFDLGRVFFVEALTRNKPDIFTQSHEEFTKALAADPNSPGALFLDGRALAHLNQDDAAKADFENFVKLAPAGDIDRQRATLYIGNIELARQRMAPAFAVTTMDGKRVSLDDLRGKVVLLDFWATWCPPCRAALPDMKKIAQKFQGQPLAILSVSLDSDPKQWQDFITKNEMTWLNYRDGGFNGPISKLFGVEAIPHTFTIDAEGVLRDEQIGDASIEGRLKKLVAQAVAAQPAPATTSGSQ
ncbi:MAG TPA: redoxin domain-containing protein [Candidatus Aquilonibacter sp.]|nr:redoxin domain-containing protein [Candidatus Aquilonibacter sp.]